MKLLLGLILGLAIGALCRVFVVPVPAPPVIEGALLVVAMTLGYGTVDKFLNKPCDSSKHCGGPDGQSHHKSGESL